MQLKTKNRKGHSPSWKVVLFFGVIVSIAIRFLLIIKSVDVADVQRMHEVALAVARGLNPYKFQNFYIYPPAWMYFEYLSLWISQALSVPFHITIKLWPTISDMLTTFLIFKILKIKGASSKKATFWSLSYFLNPIIIIISSLHGQFDSVILFLTLLSTYLVIYKKHARYLGAFVLGLAICIKPNPMILVPLFVFAVKSKLPQKILFLFFCGLPLLITTAPYLVKSFSETVSGISGYSGVYDIGYAAFFRGLLYQNNASYWIPNDINILTLSKNALLVGILALNYFLAGSLSLVPSILIVFLFFITTYLGVSAQYLTWIIPFAIVLRDKRIFSFSILGTCAITSFYLFFEPSILLGKLLTIHSGTLSAMSFYAFSNIMFFLFCACWLLGLLKEAYKKCFGELHPFRRKALLILFGVYILLLIKSLNLLIYSI